MIHPTAILLPGAQVPSSCRIGPYCQIGGQVELGENCELMSHVVIQGPAKIGAHNRFFPFGSIATDPQDLTFSGEETWLRMGDHNTVREYVTLNRGTKKGGGVTTVGSHTFILAYSHVGHDCIIGDHAMLVNGATLAGHDRGRVGGGGRSVSCTPVCAHWRAFLYWRRNSDYAGRTAIFQDLIPA